MNGAEYLIKFLHNKKVEYIFGYPGGKVLALYDALYRMQDSGAPKHILGRHEQGCIHAAEGYAKATGKTGVVFSTSGPGATNLVTGLADSMLDSVPILAITGQVNSHDIGHDAFQEADMLGVTLAVTKHNYLARSVEKLPSILEEAWQIARSRRHGPVLIDIPQDVFVAQVPDNPVVKYSFPHKRKELYTVGDQIEKTKELLAHSFRPVILAGGGVSASEEAPVKMTAFMEKYNLPCAVTLMGKSVIDAKHPLALGMAGMHGIPAANIALSQSDLIIAAGARFSDRTIGNPLAFSVGRSIIHADTDIAEISKNAKISLPVVADMNEFFNALNDIELPKEKAAQWSEWLNEINAKKVELNIDAPFEGMLKVREIIRKVVNTQENDSAIIVTDVGQHQMIAAQETRHKLQRSFITSGGLGTMGFGLPAAVGAAFGEYDSERQVVLFSGDGGIQMNIQELATVKKTKLPVKIFIFDNNRLGMVRQWQKHFYGSRYAESILDDNPDFIMLAAAYGIEGIKIDSRDGLDDKIRYIMSSKKTILVHCVTDPDENVFPLVPGGKSNHEMIISEEGD